MLFQSLQGVAVYSWMAVSDFDFSCATRRLHGGIPG